MCKGTIGGREDHAAYRNSMWTSMDKTQEVKGEEGNEPEDVNIDQAVRALLFSNKPVLHLGNNGEQQRKLNIASDSTAQLLPRNNH